MEEPTSGGSQKIKRKIKVEASDQAAPIKAALKPPPQVWDQLITEARGVIGELRLAAMLSSRSPRGTCPLFFYDTVIHAALPWADVDQYQRRLLGIRAPDDELLLTQLHDLIPSLAGYSLVDVGSFTGSTAFFLSAFMKPAVTHMFEPLHVMQEALNHAIEANLATCGPLVLHRTILDEEEADMDGGFSAPVRLSQTRYLRRQGGPFRARAIDSLDLGKIGLINMDFNNQKVPVLRGALKTIERDRPVVVMDLTARDVDEVRLLFKPLDYRDIRIGRHSMAFLPE